MPWSPSPPIEEPGSDSDERLTRFEASQGSVHWFHGVRLVGPTFQSRGDETCLAMRFLCHVLIDYLSDEGIPEVCQSLREFYQYYEPSAAAQTYLPEVCEREAIRGVRLVRPSFAVEGE